MITRYYKCKKCGLERIIEQYKTNNAPVINCLNCGEGVTYSKQVEKDWINEIDENGKRIRMEFQGSCTEDCLLEACHYFDCKKEELDYYTVKLKGIFSSLIIRAWKPAYNFDSKEIKIITDSSNVNGWIAINPVDKVITRPASEYGASISLIRIKYDKVSSIDYSESYGSIYCDLILEPYIKLDILFHPKERDNVNLLIDTLYNDLPQEDNCGMYNTCFFKRNEIPKTCEYCGISIFEPYMDLKKSCYIWKDDEYLCICNTKIRNGIKIKISDIKYYRIIGDKYVTTEVTGGGGGGTSIKGAIIGGMIAGEAGAMIRSRKPIEPIKSNSTVHDEQMVLIYSNDMIQILKFNSDIYEMLLNLLPEKEYETVIHKSQQISTIQRPLSEITDTKSKLKELKSMFEEDLITEEEYNKKREELLSKM